MVGARPEDVFQNTSGYGMFTGGLGFQYGASGWACSPYLPEPATPRRQIKFMTDFGTTVVHAIPSYATRIYEVMQQEGVDPRATPTAHLAIVPSHTATSNASVSRRCWA
jgi:phenylacetate-CoA ligase